MKTHQAELKDLKFGETLADKAAGNPERNRKGRVETIIGPSLARRDSPSPGVTLGHLLVYGMGPGKLADTLDITIGEAKELISKYFIAFPQIEKTLNTLTEQAMKNKYAYSPLDKRRRLFTGVDWDHPGKVAHLKNIAKNHPFQGAGASVTKLALCKMKRKIDEHGWDAKLINVVHDEILLSVHKDCAEEVARVLEQQMVESFNYYAPSVPMVAKAEIETYWKH